MIKYEGMIGREGTIGFPKEIQRYVQKRGISKYVFPQQR